MKFVCAFLSFVLLASTASANQVLVSVGQLSDATRLVLTFEERPNWEVAQNDQGASIKFIESALEFDIESTNAFVVGTRVSKASIDASGQTLKLEFSCNCTAQIYPYGIGSLVVEVRDKLVLAEVDEVMSAAPRQLPPLEQTDVGRPVSTRDMTFPDKESPKRLIKSESLTIHPPTPPKFKLRPSIVKLELVETLGFSIPSNSESQAVSLLSEALSRAAAQGLVDPEDRPIKRPQTSAISTPNQLIDGRSNIEIITGLDRDLLANRNGRRLTDQGQVCFSDVDVDIDSWGDTDEFGTLGMLRKAAAAENGDVLPEGAHAIARYYIALGFGSEARVAAQYMTEGHQKRLILALADIVDHGFSASEILDGQIFCDGKVALWAALARPVDVDKKPASSKTILSTFSELPPHLRAHLGPVLAERLRAIGLEDEARNAVNAVARGGGQSNESELVTARMELSGTRPDKARDRLVDLSNGTDVTAAEALLELLLDAERRGMAPNPAWVEDAPSLARATEGTDVAASVNLAGLRGRIALDQFDLLRLSLEEDTPGLDPATRNDLSVAALIAAAERADDTAFLKSEIGLSKLLRLEDIERSGRFAIAERLQSIGLPERADAYLPTDPATPMEVQIAANVLNDLGQTDQAIMLLSSQSENESTQRRAQLLAQTGMNEAAIEAFQDSGNTNEALTAAIRAGLWNWITENGDGADHQELAASARALTTPLAIPSRPGEPMNGALILSSQERRKSAEALLKRTLLSETSDAFTN